MAVEENLSGPGWAGRAELSGKNSRAVKLAILIGVWIHLSVLMAMVLGNGFSGFWLGHLMAKLRTDSFIDALTEIRNRRWFISLLSRQTRSNSFNPYE